MNFPHFILNESKCRNATISSGIYVFIIGILCLLLLLCMLYFSSALGDVAGLARCSWAGRTSPCSAEPLVSPALWGGESSDSVPFFQWWQKIKALSKRRQQKPLRLGFSCCRALKSVFTNTIQIWDQILVADKPAWQEICRWPLSSDMGQQWVQWSIPPGS